ncbi:MAG TPA: LacI family DNA-binding transcriptional regulator, partial [Phytomonospora sp.]
MARRATIADVAALANVSSATVSRALSGNYPVAESTRARIEAAVSELGYVANAQARALAGIP